MADTPDLGSGAARREGSSPSLSIGRSAPLGSASHSSGDPVISSSSYVGDVLNDTWFVEGDTHSL